MSSKHTHRHVHRRSRSAASPPWTYLRVVLALALAALMLPLLGSGASAEDATLPSEESAVQTQAAEEPAQEPAEEPAQEPVEEPAQEPVEEPAPEAGAAEEPPAEPTGGGASVKSSSSAPSATKVQQQLTVAAVPGVCDTNEGNGKIDTFSQNTKQDSSGSWINGALNQTNSDYAEGDWVPQRVQMTGLASGQHELVFTYDVTKNGKYAYDKVGKESMTGATISSWVVTNPGGPTATVAVTFEVAAGSSGSATLYFAGHIARELDWGPDMGAGSINGAPYHISLETLNCASAGQQDNQLMADAVDAGMLTVIKDATPADGTDFTFSIVPGGTSSTFYLDDDNDGTLPDRETYRVAPGSYTVEELNIPAGWSLADITCTDTPTGSSPTSRTVAISDDETVTCTFTNTKIQYADLTVTKTAKASYDRDYDWTITKDVDGAAKKYDADGTASFDYDVVVTPSEPQDSNFKVSGQITVANPNNVAFTGVSLEDKVDGDACTITALDGSAFAQPFSVSAKGDVTVRYVCAMPGASPDTSGTNTAKATWDAQSFYGTSGSASGSAGYDFTDAKVALSDGSVTVTDDRIDLSGLPGGNVVTAPETGRFDYSIEYTAESSGECTPFTNTASITDDGTVKSDSETVKICRGADLAVTKNRIASLTRTYDWDIVKSRDSEKTVYVDPQTGKATVDYTLILSAGIGTDSAWLMTGTIRVANPNDWAVPLTSITDAYPTMACSLDSAPTGEDLLVPADGYVEFDYTCTTPTKPGYTGTNTATATWDAEAAGTPSGSAEGTASVVEDDWQKTLVNDEVYVTDDGAAGEDVARKWGPYTWESGKVYDPITYALELSGEPGECVDYRNTAEVVGDDKQVLASHYADVEVCWPLDLSVTKDAEASYDTRYFWDIEKSVDPRDPVYVSAGESADFGYTVKAIPNGSEDSGWDLTGTITVSNPNLFEDVSVTLSDVYDNGTPETADDVACTVTYPDGLDHLVVPKATASAPGSASATYDCDFASQPAYEGKNHVTVFWGESGEQSSYADVVFVQDETTDKTVEVFDDKVDLETPEKLGEATWAEADGKPVPTEFTYDLTQTGEAGKCTDYTNTASVKVKGEDPEASATATLCVEDDLVVSKTVDASYKVDHHWLIDKSVDKTRVELTDDGDATFTYTVEATPNGFTTYGYAMSGTITVMNPNTYEGGAITATVTDVPEVGGGATCVVDGGESVVLAPEETKELEYTCSFTGQPTESGTNTATATWTGPGEDTREASSESPVSFVASGGKNGTVTVTDSLASPSTLGTAEWNDEGEPTVFTYALTHEGVDGTCVDHTNTATIKETGQSDSATVTVCDQGDLVLGAMAQATYDRVYGWEITKVADRDRIDTDEGVPGTVNYTVGVTPSGYVDSGWELTGVLTVLNPNTYKGVTVDLDAVPDLGEGVTCDFHATGESVVDAGQTRAFTFACDFGQQPEYEGSVELLVDWGNGSASASVDVEFEVDEATDETVTVTDDQVEPGQLGTVTWNADGETTEFEYAVEVEGRPDRCDTVTNTATIVETGQQAQADVLVCGPEILPVEEEVPKPRPPVILPATGAPSGVGLVTLLGGLMVALGTALLVLRRRHAS